ncbi:hypothetical protein EDC01DRAFT_632540 [Geopyxis carbonaria]|nr:hypothetical protein EDC01DRAFT_632540 [Geopyxis carbonaria]
MSSQTPFNTESACINSLAVERAIITYYALRELASTYERFTKIPGGPSGFDTESSTCGLPNHSDCDAFHSPDSSASIINCSDLDAVETSSTDSSVIIEGNAPEICLTDALIRCIVERAGASYHRVLHRDFFINRSEVIKEIARDEFRVYIPPGSGMWLDMPTDKNPAKMTVQETERFQYLEADMELLRQFCGRWSNSRSVFERAWRELNVPNALEVKNQGEWGKHFRLKIGAE